MKSKIFLQDIQDIRIGERLRFFRKKRGLTQSSLGAMLGISAQQLQKYEIGRNKVSASRIKYISEILNVPVDYLLNDPKQPYKDKNNILNDSANETGVGKLVYYYSLIKSEKVRKLIIQSSAVYVEHGL